VRVGQRLGRLIGFSRAYAEAALPLDKQGMPHCSRGAYPLCMKTPTTPTQMIGSTLNDDSDQKPEISNQASTTPSDGTQASQASCVSAFILVLVLFSALVIFVYRFSPG
jgi:hypothetical protein